MDEEEFFVSVYPELKTGDLLLFSSSNYSGMHEALKCRWNQVGMVYVRDGKSLKQYDKMEADHNVDSILLMEATQGPTKGYFREGERICGVDLVGVRSRVATFFQQPTVDGEARLIGVRRLQGPRLGEKELVKVEEAWEKYKNWLFQSTLMDRHGSTDLAQKPVISDDTMEVQVLHDAELIARVWQMIGLLPETFKAARDFCIRDFDEKMGLKLPLAGGRTLSQEVYVSAPAVRTGVQDVARLTRHNTIDMTQANIRAAKQALANLVPRLDYSWQYAVGVGIENPIRCLVGGCIVWWGVALSGGLLAVPLIAGYVNMMMVPYYAAEEAGGTDPVPKLRNLFVFFEKDNCCLRIIAGSLLYALILWGLAWLTWGIGAIIFFVITWYFIPLCAFKDSGFMDCLRLSKTYVMNHNAKGTIAIAVICLLLSWNPLTFTLGLNMLFHAYVTLVHKALGQVDSPIDRTGTSRANVSDAPSAPETKEMSNKV